MQKFTGAYPSGAEETEEFNSKKSSNVPPHATKNAESLYSEQHENEEVKGEQEEQDRSLVGNAQENERDDEYEQQFELDGGQNFAPDPDQEDYYDQDLEEQYKIRQREIEQMEAANAEY